MSHFFVYHQFYQTLESIIRVHDPQGCSILSTYVYGQTSRTGQTDLMRKTVIDQFCYSIQDRDYIFYNEKNMIQSRQVLLDLSQFKAPRSDLVGWLQKGIISPDTLMSRRLQPDELELAIVPRSERSVKLTVDFFKYQDLDTLDRYEEVVDVVMGQSPAGRCRFPDHLYIYGPPKKFNAGLTPLECLIVKVAYIPGAQTNDFDTTWYKEESLLKEFAFREKLLTQGSIRICMLGWFFNSKRHFRNCLSTAVLRARSHFISTPVNGKELPPISGLYEEHLSCIAYEINVQRQTNKSKEILEAYSNRQHRHAAVVGNHSLTMGDMVERRFIYLSTFEKAVRESPAIQLNDKSFGPIVFAACVAKLYGTPKGLSMLEMTFSHFMSVYPYLNLKLPQEGESLSPRVHEYLFKEMASESMATLREAPPPAPSRAPAAAPSPASIPAAHTRSPAPVGTLGPASSRNRNRQDAHGARPPPEPASVRNFFMPGASRGGATRSGGERAAAVVVPPNRLNQPAEYGSTSQPPTKRRRAAPDTSRWPPRDGRPRYVRVNPVNVRNTPPGPGHNYFSDEENNALLAGRRRYLQENYKKIWPMVLTDPDYGPVLRNRDNKQCSARVKEYLASEIAVTVLEEYRS